LVDDKDSKAYDILKNAAKRSGVPLELLSASALQEGMNLAIKNNSADKFLPTSGAYDIAMQKGDIKQEEFPVDGFYYYGLDTFADNAKGFMDKGYLPKDFQYKPFSGLNEKNENVNTAAFRNNEDALVAKGAFLRDLQDKVKSYSSKKGVKLDPDTENYLVMSAYNGGMGNAQIMLDEISSGKYKQSDYVSKGLTSRQGVHKNVAPRMSKINMLKQLISEYENPANQSSIQSVLKP
jgi:hypothetical protein